MKKILLGFCLTLGVSNYAMAGEHFTAGTFARETPQFVLATEGGPSSARGLQCICRGGPGQYPYQRAPVQKTCYGGPGNYPYPCDVCPQ